MANPVQSVRIVFFDAAGTLFHVRGSVGAIYSRIAARYGVTAPPEETERAFGAAFRQKSAEGIPGDDAAGPEESEKQWWLAIVRQVFCGRMQEPDLQAYFDEVFEHFRGAEAWELYPDARPALEDLRSRGFRLGVISNFDSRLFDVLAALRIDELFEQVIISWRAGAAKPDPRIFQAALQSMHAVPSGALHVGDSLEEDVEGALAAGMKAALLDRRGAQKRMEKGLRIESLKELRSLLA